MPRLFRDRLLAPFRPREQADPVFPEPIHLSDVWPTEPTQTVQPVASSFDPLPLAFNAHVALAIHEAVAEDAPTPPQEHDPNRKAVLVLGDPNKPHDLPDHARIRMTEMQMIAACAGCSDDERIVFHALMREDEDEDEATARVLAALAAPLQ